MPRVQSGTGHCWWTAQSRGSELEVRRRAGRRLCRSWAGWQVAAGSHCFLVLRAEETACKPRPRVRTRMGAERGETENLRWSEVPLLAYLGAASVTCCRVTHCPWVWWLQMTIVRYLQWSCKGSTVACMPETLHCSQNQLQPGLGSPALSGLDGSPKSTSPMEVMPASTLLAKASHMTKPRLRVLDTTTSWEFWKVWFIEGHNCKNPRWTLWSETGSPGAVGGHWSFLSRTVT